MRNLVDTPFDGSADVEDVISAYRLLLRRNPEADGFRTFRGQVEAGMTIERLYRSIADSEEYRHNEMAERQVVEVDCGGYYVFVRQGERDFGRTIATTKSWEPHIAGVLTRILKKGDTLVDIGANVGVMAFAGAKAVGESGKVVAIEPNPDNLQMLYAGILRNGYRHVSVLPFAASDEAGILSLGGGTSNSFVTKVATGKEFVQAVVLDEALRDLDSIDVVKIDIEGHEPHAIKGFTALLERHRPQMLMEFNPSCLKGVSGMDPRAVLETFFELLEDVRIIGYSGEFTPMKSAGQMWSHWEQKNEEAVRTNWLPDGMLHFDILATVRARG